MCMKPDHQVAPKETLAKPKKSKAIAPTHSEHSRDTKYDLLYFLLPALCWKLTPVLPAYTIAIIRMLSTHLMLTMHYIFVDKDNYNNKISQKQLKREKEDYLVGTVLHMYAQLVLQMIFPGMFFTDNAFIGACAWQTFLSHVLMVEPLYYFVHRWLHVPEVLKAMHGFHHLSISTLPSTSLVQNFNEHFVYIATFGPAFLAPFFLGGRQHWMVIGAYLVLFDLLNAYGHTNIRIRHPIFTHKYSPVRYLFYTPEFHLGHHVYFRANYGLFMPFWDHICGTFREYTKNDNGLAPADQQDFVFIGHNGGLGHLLTCPEFSVYNAYEKYRFLLPIHVELILMHIFGSFARLIIKFYKCPRYFIDNKYVGRIICLVRTPLDYASPKKYDAMNAEIVDLMRDQYKKHGTRCYGLGNWNKMKQLNDGGTTIVKLVKEDSFLKDKNIRVWTGDTLTTASVFMQLMDFPDLQELFFIGANGKIGTAVCQLLLQKRPNLKIRVLSGYEAMKHPNISYTKDLSEIVNYGVVACGKILPGSKYDKALKKASKASSLVKTRLILDYSVPFIPLHFKQHPQIKHIQIGLLESTNKMFLKGPFDVCMSHDQNHIYPCHACCILNTVTKRDTDETGDIVLKEVEKYWDIAESYGLRNRNISALV